MKILFIANAILDGENPGFAGGDVRFIEIAKHLQKQGHEIHLLSTHGGATLCKKFGLNVILHTIAGTGWVRGRLAFIIRALKCIFVLPETLRNFNEGVVYSANEMVFDVIPALRLKLMNKGNITWATVVHWLPPFPPWKRKESTLINSTMFFINERLSVFLANKYADTLLPVSSPTAKQLQDFGANMTKVHTVECGVNCGEIHEIVEKVKEKKYDAVFMKRLQAVKGIFDVIEIWEMVVREKTDAKLLVIGDGIDGQRAREMVIAKGLEKNIHFAGVIYDSKDKFTRIAESKLFVLPSYEENWAIVIGEAMAAGTPVVAYGLPELVGVWGDSFVHIPLGDKQAFAKKIVELIASPSLLKDLSRTGKDFVNKFDWQSIAERELWIILNAHLAR